MTYTEADLGKMFLPIGQMLQIQTISSIENGTIVGQRKLSESDWMFALHFPGDPIFPGSLLIEGAGQILAIWGWHNGLRGKPRLVKVAAEFRTPVSSLDKLITFTGKIVKRKNVVMGTVEITVGNRFIGTVNGSLIVI